MSRTPSGSVRQQLRSRIVVAALFALPGLVAAVPMTTATPYHAVMARADVFAQLVHGQWATSGGWPTYLKWDCDTTTQFCGKNLNIDHKKANGAATEICHPLDANHCGECVDLVTGAAHDGTSTPNWRRGSNAIDNGQVIRGTILATFNKADRYGPPNTYTQNNGHTFIFDYYVPDASGKIIGMAVFQQNWEGKYISFHRFWVNTNPNDFANAKNYAVVMDTA